MSTSKCELDSMVKLGIITISKMLMELTALPESDPDYQVLSNMIEYLRSTSCSTSESDGRLTIPTLLERR